MSRIVRLLSSVLPTSATFGYSVLMPISEAHGRYRRLAMPLIFVFAGMEQGLFIRRLSGKVQYA